ncbi:hypothetical protein [Nocardia sp. NPDC048505]|uniref:hypothetical protein n=1 Tax=unclassified Nocardia TaxID=2637762 RepID=UPI003406BE46
MAESKSHPVIDWWTGGADSWWGLPVFLLIVFAGLFTGFGAAEAWTQGQWPLFTLLALAATACAIALGPQLLGEAVVYLIVAVWLLTVPLLLFPRTRTWRARLWDGVDKRLSTE